MKVQVLVATMNHKDHTLLEKMNIQSDVIVGNQCDYNLVEEFEYCGHNAVYLNFAERGVGLNRNNSLMRAREDIVLFADDDVVYLNGYVDKILEKYQKHPTADVIIFNFLVSRNGGTVHEGVSKEKFLGKKGVSSFGTYSVSAKLDILRKNNIVFHQMFGGGAKYSHGEDSIFLKECVSKGLKVYACKDVIGSVHHNVSTWSRGLNDQYFMDSGALFACMYPKLSRGIAIYHALKHRRRYKEYGVIKSIKMMFSGIRGFNG